MAVSFISKITPEKNTLVLDIGKLFSITSGPVTLNLYTNTYDSSTETRNLVADNLYINGIKGSKIQSDYVFSLTSEVYPFIFMLHFDNPGKTVNAQILAKVNNSDSYQIKIYINNDDSQIIQDSEYEAKQLSIKLQSFMLMRTNPKLTGNIKLVVDSNYRLYLDTFKVSNRLNDRVYRKYPVSSLGNYPRDVMTVFGSLPKSELFRLPGDSLNTHKFFSDYDKQYMTEYEYGAETNMDNMYPENMKILAPLHIGKNIPDMFCIFRYEGTYNKETYQIQTIDGKSKFDDMLRNSKVVKIFDLRTYTTIGQYLNNYKDIVQDFLYGSCHLQFIEQDNEKYSDNYRQGTNSWRGIDVAKGLITNKVETTYFATDILQKSEGVQEAYNNYIINGYERNNILYPHLINVEFMFNDEIPGTETFSMHRYFGLYLSANEFMKYECMVGEGNVFSHHAYNENDELVDTTGILRDIFTDEFSNKIFCIMTNNDVARITNDDEAQNFITEYVYNNPDKNLFNAKSEFVEWQDDEQSFISMYIEEPIQYGEHLRFIAENIRNEVTGNVENVCLELIASNDKRLTYCDNYISPYISTNQLVTNKDNNTNDSLFYRIQFYTQSLTDEYTPATVEEQFERISAAINKFNSFIRVESSNSNSISFSSPHKTVYFQHIAALYQFDEPEYGAIFVTDDRDGKQIYYTIGTRYQELGDSYVKDLYNKTKSLSGTWKQPLYVQTLDETSGSNYKRAEITSDNVLYMTGTESIEDAITFVDYKADENKKEDNIRYYSKEHVSYMRPLSPNTYNFLENYSVYSLYGYESLGWRYQNIVKFKPVSELKNPVAVYNEIDVVLRSQKHPLVKIMNSDKYEVIRKTSVESGFISDNILSELYGVETDDTNYDLNTQAVYLDKCEYNTIINPHNVNTLLVDFNEQPYLHNYTLALYSPEAVQFCAMGIYGIKDMDLSTEKEISTVTEEIVIKAGEVIKIGNIDDDRIQKGVLYKVNHGSFSEISMYKFCILGDEIWYEVSQDIDNDVFSMTFADGTLTATSDVSLTVLDTHVIQDFTTTDSKEITQSIKYFFKKQMGQTEDLYIPVVPLTNCIWQSNGNYFDWNNILDVDNINNNSYTRNGYLTAHTTSPYYEDGKNKFNKNTISSYGRVGDSIMSFRDIIFDKKVKNPIRKLLIQNENIDTAIGYYNSYVQSLEFIHSGIKFTMKFNAEYYTQNLNMSNYNNFEVYIIHEFNPLDDNEIFISTDEQIILFVNHKYDINKNISVSSQTYDVRTELKSDSGYSVYPAPYSVYPSSISGTTEMMICQKTTSEKASYDENANVLAMYFAQESVPMKNYVESLIKPETFYLEYYHTDDGVINRTCIEKKTGIAVNANYAALLNYTESSSVYKMKPFALTSDTISLTQSIYRKELPFIIREFDDTSAIENTVVKTDLAEYMATYTNVFKCHLINENNVETINNTRNYSPITLTLSIPNRIKYNFGYFMPKMYDIVKFDTNDYKLGNKLNMSLLLANTKIKSVDTIKSYTGNKVFSQNTNVKKNYFVMQEKSAFASNWDRNYYRNYYYNDENNFKYLNGYIPGIEDKSFFGSKCMVFKDAYIQLDDFPSTISGNTIKVVDSRYNTFSKNRLQFNVTINITKTLEMMLQNDDNFKDNWTGLTYDIDASIKSYINNVIMKIFNTQRKFETTVFKKKDNVLTRQNSVVLDSVSDIDSWTKMDDFKSEYRIVNEDMILEIVYTIEEGWKTHPVIKIFK